MASALGSEVISWVDPLQIASDRLIWDQTEVVTASSRPGLRQLLYASDSATEIAESMVSRASLVSCHSFWRYHNIWLRSTAAKHDIPYWFVPHGGLDPYVLSEQRLVKTAFLDLGGRRFIERASCLLFTAKAERDKALAVCKPKRCEVIYWPLDEADFQLERDIDVREHVRSRLGIPHDRRCFLYFGRLHPMKKPLETIDAIGGSQTDSHLIMIGNEFGVTLEACRERAKRAGIEDRVHVIGPVYGQDKMHYFAAADAYISLSHRENFNFCAAEAMAVGLPVFLSPGNDLGGEICSADCGWLLSDDLLKTAVRKIDEIMRVPLEDWVWRGNNGREWARRHLRYDQFQQRVLELAAEIIS